MSASSGFVDLQVNGYGGVNFTDSSLTLAAVRQVVEQLYRRGTLAFCPTVITAPPSVYQHALPLLAEAMQTDWGRGRLLGIHLEGPFLSPEDGAVGAHPREYVVDPSVEVFDELYGLADGKIALLTLAPERPGGLDVIRRAVERGISVSIGHTLAGAEDVRAAAAAGARFSTHLGNGCPNLIHRHHNPIWPQLAHPDLTALLITDGHHLPPDMIRAFVHAKGAQRIIITSDAAPAAGLPPGDYAFFGTRARLEPSGRLRNLERDTLAGSAATMLDCLNHLASLDLLDEPALWRAARAAPLAALGLSPFDLPDKAAGPVVWNNGRFELVDSD